MYQVTVDFNDGQGITIYNTIPVPFDKAIKDLVDQLQLKNVILPRPGVGIGGLLWENVKPGEGFKRIEQVLV